jgi:hypothetical protein
MAPNQIADQSGIMRDGEALPKPADVATASTNEVGVGVPHSPLPWRPGTFEDTIYGADDRKVADFGIREAESRADAAFAIRAVNNHNALLAACKGALEFWRGNLRCRADETDRECLNRVQLEQVAALRDAIANAEGKATHGR